ncbi:hypothetical protein M0805_006438 [Coniferiporia weirii]|nr:hypothetical protein M0805_006438 [Coniferiporia weirii]
MSAFDDGNQSFSELEANSSWASLVVDQVQNNIEEDDYTSILGPDPDGELQDTSIETHEKSKHYIDSRTFEQVLQVMVQQGAALDNLRAELDHLRQEHRQELEHRDARLQFAEQQAHIIRSDKEKAIAALEALHTEYTPLKASGKRWSDPSSLSLVEHERIIRRAEDDARTRVERAEAEKSRLAIQLTRFQIEVAQLRNQIDDRTYPEEVLQALTTKLQQAVMGSCQSVELECGELRTAYSDAQEKLAEHKSRQDQVNEATSAQFQEQIEQLKSQNSEVEKSRDLDNEQLRSTLRETEAQHTALATDAQQVAQALTDAKAQILDIQRSYETALSDSERLRSSLKEAEEKYTTEVQRANEVVEVASSQVNKSLDQERQISKDAKLRGETLENELEALKKSHTEELASRDLTISEALTRIISLEDKLDETQRNMDEATSSLLEANEKLRLMSTRLAEQDDAEVASNKALAEANARNDELERQLEEAETSVKTILKDYAEVETRLDQATSIVDEANKGRSHAEEQIKAMKSTLRKAQKERLEATSRTELVEKALQDASSRITEVERELAKAHMTLDNVKKEHVEEISRLQNELKDVTEHHTEAKAQLEQMKTMVKSADRDRAEVQAKLEQLTQTKEALKEARKGRTEALRENERIRLMYAESEGNRAEVVMVNEELEQKTSELEQELQNTRGQLAETRGYLDVMERRNEELLEKSNNLSTQLSKSEARAEKLQAARQKMAVIYGLPYDSPLASPDRPNPPTRVGSITSRSSTSLSPSALPSPLQTLDLSGPPAKRMRLSRTRPSIDSTGFLPGTVPGSSTADVISLDDIDEFRMLPSAHDGSRNSESSGLNAYLSPVLEIPKQVFATYELFAKVASWHAEGCPVCGLCSLENSHLDSTPHLPLEFDPLLYPAQFWNHCAAEHRVVWRPDVDSFLREEIQKTSPPKSTSPIDEMIEKFAALISWQTPEGPCACGLCELENMYKDYEPRPRLDIDPSVQPRLFWSHCRSEHKRFYEP